MTIALRPAICAIILLGTVVPSKSQDWNPLFLSSMQRTGNAKQSQSIAQSQGVLESQPQLVLKPLQEIPPDYHPKFVIFGPKQNQRNPGLSGESQLLGVSLTRNSGSEDIAKQISDVQDRIEELKSQSSESPIESEQDNRTTSDLQDTLLQLQSQLSSQSSGSQSEFDSQSSGSQSQSQSGSQYVLKQISDLEPELGDLKPQSSEQTSLFSTPLNPEPKLTSDLQSTLFQVRSQLASQPSEEGLVPSPLNTELKSTLLELQSQMDSEPLGGAQSQIQSESSSQLGSRSHSQVQSNKQVSDLGEPLEEPQNSYGFNELPVPLEPEAQPTSDLQSTLLETQSQLDSQRSENGVPPIPELKSTLLELQSQIESQPLGSESISQSSGAESQSNSQSSEAETQSSPQSSGSQPQDQVPDLQIPVEEQKGNPLRVRQLPNPLDRDANSTSDLQSTLLQVHSELNSQPSENGPLSLEPRSVVQSNILEVLSQLNSQSSASNSQSSGSQFQSNSQTSVSQSSSQSISQSSSQPNTQSSSQDQVSGLEKTLDEQYRNSLGVRLLPKPLDRDANSTSDLESTLLQLHAELNSLRSENGQLPNPLNPEYKSVVQSNILEALSQLYSQTSTSQSAGSQSQSNSQSSVSQSSSQSKSQTSSQSSGSQSQTSGSQSQLQSATSSQSSGSQSQSSGSQSQLQSASSSQSSGSQSQTSGSQSQLQSISSSQSGLQSAPNSQSAGLHARLQFKLNSQPSSSHPQIPLTDRRMQFKWNSQPQLLPQILKSDQRSQSSGSQSQSSSSSQINAKIQGQLKTQLLGTQSATPSLINLQSPQAQIPSNPNRMIAGQFPAKIFVPTPAGPTIIKKLKSMKPIVFTPEYKIGSPSLPSSHLLPSGILVDSNLTTSPQVQTQPSPSRTIAGQLPVKMVVPTLARPRIIPDFKNIKPIVFTPEYKIESPPSYLSLNDILVDSKLDTNNLIEKYGYPSETHFTDTDDGYHLCLHRIPRPNGPPILLVHGLMSSSASWVELGPKNGLAYILYRKGYDVWMLNTRGNKYSRHSKRRQKPRKYWDFSFHEIGKYDLPAAIDLILNHTHKPKIQYIGHSQGSTVFFVMCSERPNYAHKVQLMQALSPTVYLRENRSPVLKFLSMFKGKYAMLLNLLGGYEISTKTKLIEQFKQHICSGSELASRICAIFDFVVCGFDWKSFNKTLTPIVAAHASQGTSAKQLYHYAQLHNFKDFQHFDHGEILNRVRYQSPKPPVYNISQALSNVVIHHGPGDWLGSDSDVIRLQERLPNLVESRRVPYDGFSHYDFTLSSDVRPLVYSHVLRHLANIHQG